MSLESIKKDISSNQIFPIYLWHGEDRFSLAQALKALKESFLREDPSGSCIELLSGKDTTPEKITEAANTASFFARRLVIVDDLPYFNTARGHSDGSQDSTGSEKETGENDAAGLEHLLKYCQNPNPGTCLVLISEKINRSRKLYKEIAKNGRVLEFAYPKGQNEWLGWIQNEVKRRGKSISTVTASALLEHAGHHTGILSSELDKLCLFIGQEQEINKEDIQAVSIPLVETTVFAMLDAIAAGNVREAVRKLTEVLSQEYYLKVHTMIVRQVRLLLAASISRQRGYPVEKMMEIAGIRSPYEGNKIYRQAAGFTIEKLCEAMEDCLRTELALKNSGGNPHLLMEMMIIRFCRKK